MLFRAINDLLTGGVEVLLVQERAALDKGGYVGVSVWRPGVKKEEPQEGQQAPLPVAVPSPGDGPASEPLARIEARPEPEPVKFPNGHPAKSSRPSLPGKDRKRS